MKSKSRRLPKISATVGKELFIKIEILKYQIGISRSSLIRMLLSNKIEKLLRLLKAKEIDELLS